MRALQPRPALVVVAFVALLAGCSDPPAITAPIDAQASVGTLAKPAGVSVDVKVDPVMIQVDGPPPVQVTITVSNPTKTSYSGASVQVRLVQGAAYRDLGRPVLSCPGAPLGTLPSNTTCTVQIVTQVMSAGPGAGVLQTGAATVEAALLQTSGKKDKVLASGTAGVTLQVPPPGDPAISSVVWASDEFVIDGGPVDYTITLSNPGTARTDVIIQAIVSQGEAMRGAGGTYVPCPSNPLGTLPAGGCTFDYYASASNGAGGAGTLVPGPATMTLQLIDGSNVLDEREFAITLVAPPAPEDPSITSVELASTEFTIDGDPVGYTITIKNPGPEPRNAAKVQATIYQGTAWRPAFGTDVQCSGQPFGVLPVGSCTFPYVTAASNSTSGVGVLVPGPATLTFELIDGVTVLDTKDLDITLVAAGPTQPYIGKVTLTSSDFDLGGAAQMATITLHNPTGAIIDPVQIDARIVQGDARRQAGNAFVDCPPARHKELPPGECTMSMSVQASNGTGGDGFLDEGPAELELTLRNQVDNVLDVKLIPINIVRP